MKIKIDFVSNSSSTSFVYISEGMLNQQEFFDAVGVDVSSPAAPLFREMFECLRYRIQKGEQMTSARQVDALASSHDFIPEVLSRMKESIEQGKSVVTGSLSSEESLAEGILCTEIVEIESERFFINAYDNYW